MRKHSWRAIRGRYCFWEGLSPTSWSPSCCSPAQVLTKDEPSQWPKLSTPVQVGDPLVSLQAFAGAGAKRRSVFRLCSCQPWLMLRNRPRSARSCSSASRTSRCGLSPKRRAGDLPSTTLMRQRLRVHHAWQRACKSMTMYLCQPSVTPPPKRCVPSFRPHAAHQVCDTVSELAASIMAAGGWPELLPFLSQAVQSGQPRLMEAALLIFAQLAGHMMDTLLQFMGTLHQVCAGLTAAITLSPCGPIVSRWLTGGTA